MDYQNDIVHENGKFAAWGFPAHVKQQNAIAKTKAVLDKARKAGVKVIFTKVEFSPDYKEIAKAKAPVFAAEKQANALVKGSWGAQIADELAPLPNETVLVKSKISAFSIPQLKKELKGIHTLILAGVATNFVVEATARQAADEDFEVIILEDCCASMNQQLHEFPLKSYMGNLAKVIKSAEIEF